MTGYPKDEAAELSPQLGYDDQLLVTGEVFHSWVIESRRPLEAELPFVAAGLDVTWTADMTPYRERKVRILNGAHTMTVLAAYLAGKETVRECMDDPLIRSYMQHGIEEEILPTLTLPRADRRGVRAQRDRTVLEPVHQALPAQHLAQLGQQVQGAHPRARCSTTSASRGGCRRG